MLYLYCTWGEGGKLPEIDENGFERIAIKKIDGFDSFRQFISQIQELLLEVKPHVLMEEYKSKLKNNDSDGVRFDENHNNDLCVLLEKYGNEYDKIVNSIRLYTDKE